MAVSTEVMQNESGALIDSGSVFSSFAAFSNSMRMANALTSSTLVPVAYQGADNLGNALIALEMAQRTGSSPMMVMQNLYVVHGKPSWSAQFIIASLNSCGKFSPLRFEMSGEGGSRACTAWALENVSGERLEGPIVSIDIAKAEGWYQKNGSKWQTMPELMLRYRAASFFGKLYAPEILMGMQTSEEIEDVEPPMKAVRNTSQKTVDSLAALKEKSKDAGNDETVVELDPKADAAPSQDDTPKAEAASQWPEVFTDPETKETTWVDSQGAMFDSKAYQMDADTAQPKVNLDGSFRKKRSLK